MAVLTSSTGFFLKLRSFILRNRIEIALLFVASFVIIWRLDINPLNDWDEAIYSQVAKEIVLSNDWLTLHWRYTEWFQKPPLYMWTTALFYRIFEVNEFWSRFASALTGIGLLFTTYKIGKNLFGRGAALAASLVLLTSTQFLYQSRTGMVDIMLTSFIYGSLYFYIRLRENNPLNWYGVWICFALAIMTKGVASFILPMTLILSLSIDKKAARLLKSRHFWLGLLSAVIIAGTWHLINYIQHGSTFLQEYIGYHVLARSTQAIEGHITNHLFYIDLLERNFMPWFYLLPIAIASILGSFIKGAKQFTPFIFIFFTTFILFSLSETKLDNYLLPLYPAAALFIGYLINQAIRQKDYTAQGALWFCLIIAFISLSSHLLMGVIFITIILAFIISRFYKPQFSVMMLAILICLSGYAIKTLRPLYTEKPADPLTQLAKVASKQNIPLTQPLFILAHRNEPSLLFYSNHPVSIVSTVDDILNNLHPETGDLAIIPQESTPLLAQKIKVTSLSENNGFELILLK